MHRTFQFQRERLHSRIRPPYIHPQKMLHANWMGPGVQFYQVRRRGEDRSGVERNNKSFISCLTSLWSFTLSLFCLPSSNKRQEIQRAGSVQSSRIVLESDGNCIPSISGGLCFAHPWIIWRQGEVVGPLLTVKDPQPPLVAKAI